MAMNINFDDGIEEITINNDKNRVLRVNVRDIGILDRVQHVADNFQNKIKTLGEELTITSDGEATVPEIAETVRKMNEGKNLTAFSMMAQVKSCSESRTLYQ